MNRLCGVVGFEEEELGNDRGGEGVVDFAVQTNNAFLVVRELTVLFFDESIGMSYLHQSREDIICDARHMSDG